MDNPSESQLEQLLAQVLANPKYSSILPDLIKGIGSHELQKRGSFKEAVKETKTKLHQATGVYVDREINYDDWLTLLRNIPPDDPAEIKNACKQIMLQHISTRERIPGLDEFYQIIFNMVPAFSSILDIACGMNPLTIPWMGLSSQHFYRGWEVNIQMVKFLAEAVRKFDTPCSIEAVDIFSVNEIPQADLVFLFKTLPCLEQVQKGITPILFNRIQAKNMIITFPASSLSGKNKGMVHHYTEMMQRWLANSPWQAQSLLLLNELVYILEPRYDYTHYRPRTIGAPNPRDAKISEPRIMRGHDSRCRFI